MLGSYIRAEGVQSEKQALLRISLWASYYVAVFTLLNSQPFGMPLSLPHYKHCGIGRCGSNCGGSSCGYVLSLMSYVLSHMTYVLSHMVMCYHIWVTCCHIWVMCC